MTQALIAALTPGDGASTGGADGAPGPRYGSVEEWVTRMFGPTFRRPLGGEYRWCAQWWRHREAIIRLTALWHTWETHRLQPGDGIATWLREHLDHQLPILLSRTGPFAHCTEDEHIEPRQARTDAAPPGWWNLPVHCRI